MKNKIYLIIGGLVLIIIVLIIIVDYVSNLPPEEDITIEDVGPVPTVTPVDAVNILPTRTPPPLPQETLNELLYPVKFEETTVVYKPQSGTFLIYYHGDKAVAEASFDRLATRLNLNKENHDIRYRSLEPVKLPPVITSQ